MKEGYTIRNQERIHFITATVVDWVDVFTRNSYRDVVIESLVFCIEKKGMLLYGYVIMSNHIHLIVQSKKGKLSDLIRDFKKFTATKILEKIQTEPESRREWMLEYFKEACVHLKRKQQYKVWQDGYHAEHIYSNKFIKQKLNYIHQNPVIDKIVSSAEDYVFSSARNYAELDNELEVIRLEVFY